jgi:hypothetical protein
MFNKHRLTSAITASSIHVICSLAVAMLAAMLVFLVWYPYPYREMSGGRELFFIIVAVDVVCGPLLTLVIFNPAKPRSELVRDLGLVAIIQMAALGYGLYTMALARPVYLVHETDRLKVVSVADIPPEQLNPTLGGLHQLPWLGPKMIGLREPKNSDEKLKSIDLALSGQESSVRPDWWQSYDLNRSKVLARSRSVAELRTKRPTATALIDKAVAQSGKTETELRYIPMTSFKTTDWVAFIDAKTADPLAYAPIDGF